MKLQLWLPPLPDQYSIVVHGGWSPRSRPLLTPFPTHLTTKKPKRSVFQSSSDLQFAVLFHKDALQLLIHSASGACNDLLMDKTQQIRQLVNQRDASSEPHMSIECAQL